MRDGLRVAVSVLIFAIGASGYYLGFFPREFSAAIVLLAYVIVGYSVIIGAFSNIARKRFLDEKFLMTVASIGAFLIGEYPEGAAVMIFYSAGTVLENRAVDKARKSMKSLMEIRSDYANIEENGVLKRIDPSKVSIGGIIVVKPGERVPLDGIVVEGHTSLDVRALTGESMPIDVREGDSVISGSVNLTVMFRMKVTECYEKSTASRIIEIMEEASVNKARTEKFITRFSRYYTPAVVSSAILLALIPPLVFGNPLEWIYRALTFLVISCPCALAISVPLAFFGGMGRASKSGIIIKGGNYMEVLSQADTFVFDKTGTLTNGEFRVKNIHAVNCDEKYLIETAAKAEYYSDHPLSEPIRGIHPGDISPDEIEHMSNIAGKGVAARINGKTVHAGNHRLMEDIGAEYCREDVSGSNVHVAENSDYLGHIEIADTIKEDAASAIAELRACGARRIIILTGDGAYAGRAVGDAVGISDVCSGLLPGDKLKELERIIGSGNGTVFIGDGINDAPSLVRSDTGIAMGVAGSDAAVEAADVVIMDDKVSKVVSAVRISKKTMRTVKTNIAFVLGVKFGVLALASLGMAGMWSAIFADVGVSLIAIANSVRLLTLKNV